MAHFPIPHVAETVLNRFFIPGGRPPRTPYKALPMYKQTVSLARNQITMLASFVEVWLAREGHDKPVGVNLLTKVQMPNLPTLYGAMLAGVGYVLMGAGIPREIPECWTHSPTTTRFRSSSTSKDCRRVRLNTSVSIRANTGRRTSRCIVRGSLRSFRPIRSR
jgi:NAD(P)H-dependent flavin oxidoreductase YrpB (nitropropane dioxygenase family)